MKPERSIIERSTNGQAPASDRGREREAEIIKVATDQFLENGYGGTKLYEIAKVAGGPNFFPTKADLFRAAVTSVVADRHPMTLDPEKDVYKTLFEYSCERLSVVFAKRHWSLLRLVQAERDRFPEIAKAYYYTGPQNSAGLLAKYFRPLNTAVPLTFISAPVD